MEGYGIYTMLGTPTAAPPAWIIEENPDILPMDSKWADEKALVGVTMTARAMKLYRIAYPPSGNGHG